MGIKYTLHSIKKFGVPDLGSQINETTSQNVVVTSTLCKKK